MCVACLKLDEKIAHYKEFLKQPFDQLTLSRIRETIQELEQQKAAMH